MPKVILLTGFEPFGGEKVNPSILAYRRLNGKRYNGYMIKVEEVPLRFSEIRGTIERARRAHLRREGELGGPGPV